MRKNEGDLGVAWHHPTKTTYGNPDVLLLSVLGRALDGFVLTLGGSDPVGTFFAPPPVMKRNAGFLVPGTTEVCTFLKQGLKTGGDPR